MAMSPSEGSAQQLPGTAAVSATAQQSLPAAGVRRTKKVPTRWLIERGAARASAPVDVRGGFPGGIRIGNVLERVQLVVSARYLSIGEGAAAGFALRLHELRGAGLVRHGRQAAPCLVVRYQDADVVRTFGVAFRGLARTFSGRWRAEEVLQAL